MHLHLYALQRKPKVSLWQHLRPMLSSLLVEGSLRASVQRHMVPLVQGSRHLQQQRIFWLRQQLPPCFVALQGAGCAMAFGWQPSVRWMHLVQASHAATLHRFLTLPHASWVHEGSLTQLP